MNIKLGMSFTVQLINNVPAFVYGNLVMSAIPKKLLGLQEEGYVYANKHRPGQILRIDRCYEKGLKEYLASVPLEQ